MGRLPKLGVIAAALLSAPLPSSHAQGNVAVEEFVANLNERLQSMPAQAEAAETRRHERCRTLISSAIELGAMTRAAASEIWDRMTPHQRTAFQTAFESHMAATCVRAVRDYNGAPIVLAGVRPGGGGDHLATVRVALANGGERMVTWRLRSIGGRTRAVDIIADGRSVVIAARAEYAGFLQSHGDSIDVLIASLRR